MRKQVYEGVEGQDEATVRPFDRGGRPLEYEGMLVVRATLTLANGTQLPGILYYTPDATTYGPLATSEVRADVYRKLGADAAGVFPVRYASEVPLATGPISGEIPGFLYIATRRKGWFSGERVVVSTI